MHLLSLFAYVDPGTGSLVLQLLVAGLLSAGVVFGRARSRVLALLAWPVVRRRERREAESCCSTRR